MASTSCKGFDLLSVTPLRFVLTGASGTRLQAGRPPARLSDGGQIVVLAQASASAVTASSRRRWPAVRRPQDKAVGPYRPSDTAVGGPSGSASVGSERKDEVQRLRPQVAVVQRPGDQARTSTTPGTSATVRSTISAVDHRSTWPRIGTRPSWTSIWKVSGSSQVPKQNVFADRPGELIVGPDEGPEEVGSRDNPQQAAAFVDYREAVRGRGCLGDPTCRQDRRRGRCHCRAAI